MVNTVTDLKFTDVIDNTDGTGYFNEIMTSVKGHINTEYQAGRIVGADYATVFLGSMQYALDNAIQYALQQQVQNQQAELLASQVLLTDAKALTESKQQDAAAKQATLYSEQATAFRVKAQQDKTKLLIDAFNMLTAQDAISTAVPNASLFGVNITDEIDKMNIATINWNA